MWLSGDALIRGCRLVPRTLRLRKHPIGLALGMDFADEPLRLACRLRRGLPGKLLDLDSCRVERIESARTAARPGRRVRAATGRCPLSSMGASDGPQACHTPPGDAGTPSRRVYGLRLTASSSCPPRRRSHRASAGRTCSRAGPRTCHLPCSPWPGKAT